jgi:hypothetical protein
MTTRTRVLVPLTYGLSVRYLVPTGVLDELRGVCLPVVGLGWEDDDLAGLLGSRGIESIRLPPARLDHEYRMFRRRLKILHRRRLATPTAAVQDAMFDAFESPKVRAIGHARNLVDWFRVTRPGGAAAVEAQEGPEIERGTNIVDFRRFLDEHDIGAVLSVTPYHDEDGLLLWAAAERGLPGVISVISFDNPTTRARLISRGDRILVWNHYNADEIRRAYPELGSDHVRVIGAPQFDLHRRDDLVVTDREWRAALELPPDRPIILYGAGPSQLVPGEDRLVDLIDRAIDDGRIPGRPFVLVRRHPAERPGGGRRLRHGRIVEPWSAGSDPDRRWPDDEELVVQMSSLAHSAVHVSVCSSMTLDGAMFDRPQVGPTFIPGSTRQVASVLSALFTQEHWLPIARSGAVAVAADEASLISAIADGLERPESRRRERARLVEDVLTYDDGRSSGRLVAEVGDVLASSARRSSA